MKLLRNLTGALLVATLSVSLCEGQAPSFKISNFAGNGTPGFSGDGSAATGAQLNTPFAVAISGSSVYISDQANNRIRLVTGGTISTIVGTGTAGNAGDGNKATSAQITSPTGIAVASSGTYYLSDTQSHEVRAVSSGNINRFAGTPGTSGFAGDGAAATSANVDLPTALLLDSAGNVYIADTDNNRIRKVTTDGNINTFAGNGNMGFAGDGGSALGASFNRPQALAQDAAGNIYVADTDSNRIRKITTNGNIATIAGSGSGAGYGGDGGPAISAVLNHPRGVAVDGAGNVYIADTFNQRIRVVLPNGTIYTIAGLGIQGYGGDGGPALVAEFNFPTGVAVSGSNVYVTDSGNHAIRLLTPSPGGAVVSGVAGASAYGAFPTVAPGSWIEVFGTNLSTTTRGWTSGDFSGINAPQFLDGVSVTIGGQLAFVSYVSPTQVNAQIPFSVGTGFQQVFVSNSFGTTSSAPAGVNVASTMPGLLAPTSFKIGGKQYVAAFFPDGTYVLPPNSIPGITSKDAKPGDTIVLYGVGCGPVTPTVKAGQTVQFQNKLTTPVQILFGQTAAVLGYQGLSPGSVGLYQFNVVVPNVAANDATQLTLTQGGVTNQQTLFTAVSN